MRYQRRAVAQEDDLSGSSIHRRLQSSVDRSKESIRQWGLKMLEMLLVELIAREEGAKALQRTGGQSF
jgi:hypothetical protein